MALSTTELDALRFHLGYGNITIGAEPYTPDTFHEVFAGVVSPHLSVGDETTSSTAVIAGAITVVTPAAMTGIAANVQLVVDVGADAEIVTVQAVTGSTFTARFAKAHASTGYPVATMSGLARLRMLIGFADAAWQSMTSSDVGSVAGLKSVDKGDVVWFEGYRVLRDRLGHYQAIIGSIASLIRVQPEQGDRRVTRLEAY